jgi:cell division protease FtsH
MVTEYGMSDELGPMTFGHGHEEQVFLGRDISRDRNYSERVAAEIDAEMKSIIEQAYRKAEEIVKDHRKELEAVANALLERETLEAADFERLLNSFNHDIASGAPDDTSEEG